MILPFMKFVDLPLIPMPYTGDMVLICSQGREIARMNRGSPNELPGIRLFGVNAFFAAVLPVLSNIPTTTAE
jgi:hypothetical protein